MNLLPNERLIFKESQHWIILLFPAFLSLPGFCCLFAALVMAFQSITPDLTPQQSQVIRSGPYIYGSCATCFLTIALFVAIHAVLNYARSNFYITNKRVVIERGVISRYFGEIFYDQVETINVVQPFLGQFLNYGTVVVVGTGGTPEYVKRISNPHKVRERINQYLSTNRPGRSRP